MNDLNWPAIFLGLVVDWVATLFVSVYLAWQCGMFAPGWIEDDAVQERATQKFMTTPYLLANLVLGSICTSLGGAVTVGSDFHQWFRQALAMGVISIFIGLIVSLYTEKMAPSPLWYKIAGLISVVPAALLGGWIRVSFL